MRYEVSIFVESTWKGPARRAGAAKWLVEYKREDRLFTREGTIYLEDGTENQGNLKAITEALGILTKPCSCRVFTQCEHILNTTQNAWQIQWKKNDWKNAKGKPVKNAELWQQLMEKMQMHSCTFSGGHTEYSNVLQADCRKELDAHGG